MPAENLFFENVGVAVVQLADRHLFERQNLP